MNCAFTLPEDALKYRVALGHIPSDKGMVALETPYLSLSTAPAGSTASMSAENLLKFAQMQMAGGALNGKSLLSSSTAKRMIRKQFAIDKTNSWGLGWMLSDWTGTQFPEFATPDHDLELPFQNYEGSYDTYMYAVDIYQDDGKLLLNLVSRDGEDPTCQEPVLFELHPASLNRCVVVDKENSRYKEVRFINHDRSGRPDYLRIGGRLARRI